MDDREIGKPPAGSGADEQPADGERSVDADERLTDAVELVSHEARAEMLVALANRHREAPQEPTLGFAELRKRVGHDDPGNFNYHLQRLTDGLVEKTDEGYELSDVGHQLVGALLSERYDPETELQLPDAELSCVLCDRTATPSYVDGMLRVECAGPHSLAMNVGPEVLTDRRVEAAVNVALWKSQLETRLTVEGICPVCDGATHGGLEPGRGDEEPAVVYRAVCDRCGCSYRHVVGGCVLDHPAVVSLCYDHGLDVREDAQQVLADHVGTPAVLDDDPMRVAVEVSVGGDALTLELDETAAVVSVDECAGT